MLHQDAEHSLSQKQQKPDCGIETWKHFTHNVELPTVRSNRSPIAGLKPTEPRFTERCLAVRSNRSPIAGLKLLGIDRNDLQNPASEATEARLRD